MSIKHFVDREPDPMTQWRAIVLFGRNVASYKFALAEALLRYSVQEREFVPLEELADPFSAAICRHLKRHDRQCEQPSSRVLDACRRFNSGELGHEDLLARTARLGFDNVIDAFHRVGNGDVPTRFFFDERSSKRPGLRIPQETLEMTRQSAAVSLAPEVEARWRLVETAWNAGVPVKSLEVRRVPESMELAVELPDRRVSITGVRQALVGYQRGCCFYCRAPIDVTEGAPLLADVDHLFPWALRTLMFPHNVDGVWNLVLACPACNRGPEGKLDFLPALRFLEDLNNRNEYFVASHHPLRETLIKQTGNTAPRRLLFLQGRWDECRSARPGELWSPGTLSG